MQKLITYLKQGKGRGLRAMLIFSLLIGLLMWGILYSYTKKISSNLDLNDFVNQLPTIVIKDGSVVEPSNANTVYFFEGQPVFHLQSDRDEVSPLAADGFYLTRKTFVVKAEGQIRKATYLSDNIIITPERIMDIVRSFALWIPILMGLVYFAILWIFYLIVVGVSALVTLICRFKLNKGAVWRTASFAVIPVMLIYILMGLLGYSVGSTTYPMVVQLCLSVLLVSLIAFGIREKKETNTEKKLSKKEGKKKK